MHAFRASLTYTTADILSHLTTWNKRTGLISNTMPLPQGQTAENPLKIGKCLKMLENSIQH
jgi:hypothetical protein